jgi:signal transduction protein with GAF and PtsI domain
MEKKHLDLLLSISEIDWVLGSSSDIESLLHKVVSLVSGHMKSDVCSVYHAQSIRRSAERGNR